MPPSEPGGVLIYPNGERRVWTWELVALPYLHDSLVWFSDVQRVKTGRTGWVVATFAELPPADMQAVVARRLAAGLCACGHVNPRHRCGQEVA